MALWNDPVEFYIGTYTTVLLYCLIKCSFSISATLTLVLDITIIIIITKFILMHASLYITISIVTSHSQGLVWKMVICIIIDMLKFSVMTFY